MATFISWSIPQKKERTKLFWVIFLQYLATHFADSHYGILPEILNRFCFSSLKIPHVYYRTSNRTLLRIPVLTDPDSVMDTDWFCSTATISTQNSSKDFPLMKFPKYNLKRYNPIWSSEFRPIFQTGINFHFLIIIQYIEQWTSFLFRSKGSKSLISTWRC